LRNLILALTVIATAVYLLPDAQKARFASAGDDKTSIQRLLYWKHGVEMVKEHPVLGVGYYNFPAYYTAHWPEDILFGVAQLPHNIFVQVGTDAGLLGLGCFGALILQTMLIARRVRKLSEMPALHKRMLLPAARGLHIAMWGFVIAGQFVTVTYYPFFWINLAMMVATGNVARQMAGR
jgi:O-antigen ligase